MESVLEIKKLLSTNSAQKYLANCEKPSSFSSYDKILLNDESVADSSRETDYDYKLLHYQESVLSTRRRASEPIIRRTQEENTGLKNLLPKEKAKNRSLGSPNRCRSNISLPRCGSPFPMTLKHRKLIDLTFTQVNVENVTSYSNASTLNFQDDISDSGSTDYENELPLPYRTERTRTLTNNVNQDKNYLQQKHVYSNLTDGMEAQNYNLNNYFNSMNGRQSFFPSIQRRRMSCPNLSKNVLQLTEKNIRRLNDITKNSLT